MTIARSITQKTEMILRLCQWLDEDIADGGWSMTDSMGQTDLQLAVAILRARADAIEDAIDALLANAPSALEPHHEPAA